MYLLIVFEGTNRCKKTKCKSRPPFFNVMFMACVCLMFVTCVCLWGQKAYREGEKNVCGRESVMERTNSKKMAGSATYGGGGKTENKIKSCKKNV